MAGIQVTGGGSGGSLPVPAVEDAGLVLKVNTEGDALEFAPVSQPVVPATDIRGVDVGTSDNETRLVGARLTPNVAVQINDHVTAGTLTSAAAASFGVAFPGTMDADAALLDVISLKVVKLAGADGVPIVTSRPTWYREFYTELGDPFSVNDFLAGDFLAGDGDATAFSDSPLAIVTTAAGLYQVEARARWHA